MQKGRQSKFGGFCLSASGEGRVDSLSLEGEGKGEGDNMTEDERSIFHPPFNSLPSREGRFNFLSPGGEDQGEGEFSLIHNLLILPLFPPIP
jgi:hypothetical protein